MLLNRSDTYFLSFGSSEGPCSALTLSRRTLSGISDLIFLASCPRPRWVVTDWRTRLVISLVIAARGFWAPRFQRCTVPWETPSFLAARPVAIGQRSQIGRAQV